MRQQVKDRPSQRTDQCGQQGASHQRARDQRPAEADLKGSDVVEEMQVVGREARDIGVEGGRRQKRPESSAQVEDPDDRGDPARNHLVSSAPLSEELFVPDYRGVDFQDVLRGSLDNGLKGSLWKAPSLGWAFSLMAGMSIGIAEGALERFLERSAGRPIRGTTYKNQLEAPLTHLMLAEVHSKMQSATLMTSANADETDQRGVLAAAGTPADPKYLQLFGARVLVETAYAARWCAEAIELLQRNSGSTAIMDFEPIQRAWRDARVITLHGALNLEALSENYGRLMAGLQPHHFAGITTLDRFAPTAVKAT